MIYVYSYARDYIPLRNLWMALIAMPTCWSTAFFLSWPRFGFGVEENKTFFFQDSWLSPQKYVVSYFNYITHKIHVWYIYLHLIQFFMVHEGQYAIHIDPTADGNLVVRDRIGYP